MARRVYHTRQFTVTRKGDGMDNTPRSSSGYAGERDTGDLVKEQVSQGAQQALDKTQEMAGQMAGQAKSKAQSAFESGKHQVTENLSGVSHALRTTSQNLESETSLPIGGLFDGAAGGIDGVRDYLQSKSLDDLMYDAENFARRNTLVFLGGAFALGLAAARFLKSSAPRPSYGGAYGTLYDARYTSGQGYGYDRASDYQGAYGGGTDYGSTDYRSGSYAGIEPGSGAPTNDLATSGLSGMGTSFDGSPTGIDTPDVVLEDEAAAGAIDGETSK